MGKDCDVLIPEDFVLNTVTNPKLRDKYQEYCFSDFVKVCNIISALLRFLCICVFGCCVSYLSSLQAFPFFSSETGLVIEEFLL